MHFNDLIPELKRPCDIFIKVQLRSYNTATASVNMIPRMSYRQYLTVHEFFLNYFILRVKYDKNSLNAGLRKYFNEPGSLILYCKRLSIFIFGTKINELSRASWRCGEGPFGRLLRTSLVSFIKHIIYPEKKTGKSII